MLRWSIVLLAACAAAPHVTPAPPAKLADLGWLAGTWQSLELAAHWQRVGGALYGIAFDNQGGFEVNIIDDTDDDGKPAPITLVALHNGRDPMRFALSSATPERIELVDPKHRTVRVIKTDNGWRGEFVEPGHDPTVTDMRPGALDAPPELAATDRAFAADSRSHGADAWVRYFADDGAMWRGARIEKPAIHDVIANTLAKGTLAWSPVASGARGDLGFTLGTYTFEATHGSYATIWRAQPDDTWKVIFGVGWPR